MRQFIILSALIAMTISGYSQVLNFEWTGNLVSSSISKCRDVAIDHSENVISVGSFFNTQDFDPGSGTYNMTTSWEDIYIRKLDASGNFVWAKQIGGSSQNVAYAVVCDTFNNIFVYGILDGIADFDPGGGSHILTSNGGRDIFLLNLNAGGNFEWAHNFGGSLDDNGMAISSDTAGNWYCTGSFYETIDLQPGSGIVNLEAPTSFDIFLCKYSNAGTVMWAESIEGTSNVDKPYSVIPSESGNVYLAGVYDDVIDFDPGPGEAIFSSTLGIDVFCVKFSQCYPAAPIPILVNLPDTTTQCSIASLTPPQAMESCYGTIDGIPDISFPITTQGTVVITWTYDVGGGNVTTQTQNVIIEDTTAPVPNQSSLPDVIAECQLTSLIAPTATDNCGGTITGTQSTSLPITTIGTTVITWTYDDGNGNSITQTQNVVITEIDNSVNQVDALTLSANATGYTYQWLDCNNSNAPISGETGQTFVAFSNGSYAVQISDGTCTVTSTCYLISEVGISETDLVSVLIYPNPSNGTFKIQPIVKHSSIEIYDERGCLIERVESLSNEQTIIVTSSGTYFVHVFQDGRQVEVYPIVVAL